MARITTLKPRIATLDTRTAKPLPKEADEHYGTAEHRAWAIAVKQRAGWRCEFVENGQRCTNRHPTSVLYADHTVEIKDGGAKLDLKNSKCLCASHHVRKTISERSRRMAQRFE